MLMHEKTCVIPIFRDGNSTLSHYVLYNGLSDLNVAKCMDDSIVQSVVKQWTFSSSLHGKY